MYPFLPFITRDSKPLEERNALWKMKLHISLIEIGDSNILKQHPLFYPGLSLRQRQEQSRIIGILHKFLVNHGIVIVAYGGIVFGALQQHGLVPWDADCDFVIEPRFVERLDEAVKND